MPRLRLCVVVVDTAGDRSVDVLTLFIVLGAAVVIVVAYELVLRRRGRIRIARMKERAALRGIGDSE